MDHAYYVGGANEAVPPIAFVFIPKGSDWTHRLYMDVREKVEGLYRPPSENAWVVIAREDRWFEFDIISFDREGRNCVRDEFKINIRLIEV